MRCRGFVNGWVRVLGNRATMDSSEGDGGCRLWAGRDVFSSWPGPIGMSWVRCVLLRRLHLRPFYPLASGGSLTFQVRQ